MTITFTPSETDLGSFLTGEDVSLSISITSDSPGANLSLTVTQDIETPNVSISNTSNSSVSISGIYENALFPNYHTKYVKEGTSDIVEFKGFPSLDMCDVNELFWIRPDPRQTITVTYTAVANTGVESATQQYTVEILQNYSRVKDYIRRCL